MQQVGVALAKAGIDAAAVDSNKAGARRFEHIKNPLYPIADRLEPCYSLRPNAR